MVEINYLSGTLAKHIKSLPAGQLVADTQTAFESWFRVELAYILTKLFPRSRVEFNFNYTLKDCQKKKADICLHDPGQKPIVFELKSFVIGADANKKAEFPKQNDLLYQHIKNDEFSQGISFVTFVGYSDEQIAKLLPGFYPTNHGWQISNAEKLGAGKKLQFYCASVSSQTLAPLV
jgi:hypothetical protein